MRKSIYPVVLTEEERVFARGIVKAGKESARVIRRANMLLMMDENTSPTMKREDIAALLGVSSGTVHLVSKQYCQEGLLSTLTPKRQDTQHPAIKIDGVVEAHIEQIACSKPPKGRSGWTLQLIANRLIELRIVDHICPESVRKVLKKRTSSASE